MHFVKIRINFLRWFMNFLYEAPKGTPVIGSLWLPKIVRFHISSKALRSLISEAQTNDTNTLIYGFRCSLTYDNLIVYFHFRNFVASSYSRNMWDIPALHRLCRITDLRFILRWIFTLFTRKMKAMAHVKAKFYTNWLRDK